MDTCGHLTRLYTPALPAGRAEIIFQSFCFWRWHFSLSCSWGVKCRSLHKRPFLPPSVDPSDTAALRLPADIHTTDKPTGQRLHSNTLSQLQTSQRQTKRLGPGKFLCLWKAAHSTCSRSVQHADGRTAGSTQVWQISENPRSCKTKSHLWSRCHWRGSTTTYTCMTEDGKISNTSKVLSWSLVFSIWGCYWFVLHWHTIPVLQTHPHVTAAGWSNY